MSDLKQNLKTLQQYEKELKEARKKAVYVGLPKGKASDTYENGETVIQVGAIHEFGMGRNPERSFLRVPFKKNEGRIKGLINKQFSLIFNGEADTVQSLNKIGILARNISVESFTDNDWPENTPATIERKGSSRPLIDTGALRQSITWVVR